MSYNHPPGDPGTMRASFGETIMAWTHWLQSRPFEWLNPQPPGPVARVPTIEGLRQQVLSLLDDCQGTECTRLRWRLHTAECAQDLWMLRGPIFQVIASQHCQSQAAARINDLVPVFEPLLPRGLIHHV